MQQAWCELAESRGGSAVTGFAPGLRTCLSLEMLGAGLREVKGVCFPLKDQPTVRITQNLKGFDSSDLSGHVTSNTEHDKFRLEQLVFDVLLSSGRIRPGPQMTLQRVQHVSHGKQLSLHV